MTVQLIQTYPQQMEFLAAYFKVQFEVPLAFELYSLGRKNNNSKHFELKSDDRPETTFYQLSIQVSLFLICFQA